MFHRVFLVGTLSLVLIKYPQSIHQVPIKYPQSIHQVSIKSQILINFWFPFFLQTTCEVADFLRRLHFSPQRGDPHLGDQHRWLGLPRLTLSCIHHHHHLGGFLSQGSAGSPEDPQLPGRLFPICFNTKITKSSSDWDDLGVHDLGNLMKWIILVMADVWWCMQMSWKIQNHITGSFNACSSHFVFKPGWFLGNPQIHLQPPRWPVPDGNPQLRDLYRHRSFQRLRSSAGGDAAQRPGRGGSGDRWERPPGHGDWTAVTGKAAWTFGYLKGYLEISWDEEYLKMNSTSRLIV